MHWAKEQVGKWLEWIGVGHRPSNDNRYVSSLGGHIVSQDDINSMTYLMFSNLESENCVHQMSQVRVKSLFLTVPWWLSVSLQGFSFHCERITSQPNPTNCTSLSCGSTWQEPTQTLGEHTNSTQKGLCLLQSKKVLGLNPLPGSGFSVWSLIFMYNIHVFSTLSNVHLRCFLWYWSEIISVLRVPLLVVSY